MRDEAELTQLESAAPFYARMQPTRSEMRTAFLRSDATYDGVFYTGVTSTGIFCRPSCPARKPRVENVEFFESVQNAMFAGYRPCLRCRPLDTSHPEWVERLLAAL